MASSPVPSLPGIPAVTADLDLASALTDEVEILAILRILRTDLGLTQEDVARATGASARSVHNWEKRGELRQSFEDRLRDLAHVVAELSAVLTPRGVNQWLHARNRVLGGGRPLDVLGSNDPGPALEAVRLVAGGTANV